MQLKSERIIYEKISFIFVSSWHPAAGFRRMQQTRGTETSDHGAPAVETEIGGYITETESSTPESQSVSGTIRLPIQEPEHQNESSTESEVVSASIYIGSNGSSVLIPMPAEILSRRNL